MKKKAEELKERDWNDSNTWKQYIEDFKEYHKQHPIKKSVRQRNKKSPISIKGNISLPDNTNDRIQLKITAMPNDWRKLISFFEYYPKSFNSEFKNTFLSKVLPLFDEKIKPRGVNYKRSDFVEKIKKWATLYYIVFKYLFGLPEKERPEGFTKLLSDLDKENIICKNKAAALDLTIHFMKEKFGKEAFEKSLKEFDNDSDSFYKTYIQRSGYLKSFKKLKVNGKTLQDIVHVSRGLINGQTLPRFIAYLMYLIEIGNKI